MSHEHKLSLRSAFLMNINVMFGTGIFINTVLLSKEAGVFGFLGYPIVAILGLPIILTFAHLTTLYPQGGFYGYSSKEINRLAGFISTWAYVVGKLASGALLTNVFVTLLQTVIPALKVFNPLALDIALIGLMTWANLHHLKTGTKITYAFIVLKLVPALFVIGSGIALFYDWKIPADSLLLDHVPSTLPLVLYTFSGFETCLSLSRLIENPEKNMPRIIFYSYLFSISISMLYQCMFFLAAGPELMHADSYLQAFPLLAKNLFGPLSTIAPYVVTGAHIAAAAAALGGSYGILLSVHWNIYTLAQHQHLPFRDAITKLNSHHMPTVTILGAAGIYCIFLLATGAQQIALQQTSSLGLSITYLVAVIAYFFTPGRSLAIGVTALLGSLVFVASTANSLLTKSSSSLVLFAIGILIGLVMYWNTDGKNIPNTTNEF